MAQEAQLNQAIAFIKAGNKNEAIPILKNIIKTDRDNELAWLWMSACVEKAEDKKFCLNEALRINPNSEHTKKALDQLEPKPPLQPTLEEMGLVAPTLQTATFSQPIPNVQNSKMPQTQTVASSNTISTLIIVLLVIMGMFWLVIGFIQLEAGSWFIALWNILISIINLALIRDVLKRNRKVVSNLTFLGVVGSIWGVIQLSSGSSLQVCAIPLYIILAVLAQTNKEYFMN
jgi:hypothetical protein